MKTKKAVKVAPLISFEQALSHLGLTAHAEQSVIIDRMQTVTDTRHIGLIEAPTATGKTLTIAYHAIKQASEAEEAFVVAVPTIELAHQTASAVISMQDAMSTRIPISIIVGKHEFLSCAGITTLCDSLPKDAAKVINEWVAAGAPGRSANHTCWTRDGLDQWLRARDFSINLQNPALALGPSDAGSDADIAYKKQFTLTRGILIVTHAMMARDLLTRFVETSRKRRKENMRVDPRLTPSERWLAMNQQRLEVETGDEGRLPDYRQCIVDEAHLLRENFESSMRTGISIANLISQITALSKSEKNLVPAAVIKELKTIKTQLSKAHDGSKGDRVIMSWAKQGMYSGFLERIDTAIDRIKLTKAPINLENEVSGIKRAKYAIQESLRARDSVNTTFEWSPVKSFPTITVGRRTMNSEFNLLWERLHSACLISATLYTENANGPSADYISARLYVPASRRKSFRPIPATWIMDPVTAMLPNTKSAADLEPGDDKLRLDRMAKIIAGIKSSSGVLVLSTSRADTIALVDRLKKLTQPERILNGANENLSFNKQRYTDMVKAGDKPIWFAQGPAWTGLDLADNLIDNLVITRLPFPVPDAALEGQKVQYGGAKISQMLMTFKQGIGRLVRSRTASKKKLWVLDGRILRLDSAKGALRLIRSYSNREF